MFYHSFLIKYAEIGTKGKNRYVFEDALMHDIKHKLEKVDAIASDLEAMIQANPDVDRFSVSGSGGSIA